jgi:shikimate kinase
MYTTHSRICLMGMPASGKSHFGRYIAQRLDYEYIDTDSWIQKEEDMTIPQIFEKYGEMYFREKEQLALQSLIHQEKVVIATGGGTPCFFDNLQYIKSHCLSVYLKVDIPTLLNRILQDNAQKRPLFANLSEEGITQKLQEMLNIRERFYQQAHLCISFD